MFLGFMPGSIGEISALALLIGGAYLLIRKVINWRIPVAFIGTVAVLTFIFPRNGYANLDWMLYNLLSGGLLLGAFFMATDYSSSPVTLNGQLLFGFGCGTDCSYPLLRRLPRGRFLRYPHHEPVRMGN